MKKKLLLVFLCVLSFSLEAKDYWERFKETISTQISEIPGFCSKDESLEMMETIHKHQCKNCVEIGVFSGRSLVSIAYALQYNGSGKVTGIDSWNKEDALKGFSKSHSHYLFWEHANYEDLFNKTNFWIGHKGLKPFCQIVKKRSLDVVDSFEDNSIDFIHFDGNTNEPYSLQDVIAYFPKIKDRGFILLSKPNLISMRQPLVYLLERTELHSSFSRASEFLLFRKNPERLKNAHSLINQ